MDQNGYSVHTSTPADHMLGRTPYEQGKEMGRAHAIVDTDMVAEHSTLAANLLGFRWETNREGREQFMEGYGYGFSEKKLEIATTSP
jgi:hypothetical protein